MGCACGNRANIEDHIRDFIDDMVMSKTSIIEYKKSLDFVISQNKFNDQKIFEKEFLDPLFESRTGNFIELKKHVVEYFYEIKNKYLVNFIVSLSFLSDTINYSDLKSNYQIILYKSLPEDLTKVIRSKNDLRIFKKFIKFYVKMVSQFIVGALEKIYSQNIEDKNALDDLKIIYGNVYINEFIKRLFENENEKDFNLEKFISLHFDMLKHNKIREKLFEIYLTSPKLQYDKDTDETDIFSYIESEKNQEILITNNLEKLDFQIENSDEKLSLKEYSDEENNISLNSAVNFVTNKKEISIYDEYTIENAASKLTKITKGVIYRKQFITKIKPELEKQQIKIHEYIVNNFPSEKVKKAESNRRQQFSIDGWKKFYPQNTKIFNVNHGEVHETKFLIFNGNEYYSGLLNRKGQKHGFGISIHRQGEKYQGFFFENNYHGWGELIEKNGNIFQGQFIHGNINGRGEKYSLDGTYYIGDFENFQKHGEGQEDSEFYIYRGGFKKGKKNGKGKIYMKVLKDTYEGDFIEDNITGAGEYHWSNENIYVGEFFNGKMHGKGINKWPNGTVYEGEYRNGIKEGFGRYMKTNGKTYEGYFKNGKPHGKGVLISAKGTFQVEFENGKLTSSNANNIKIQEKEEKNQNLILPEFEQKNKIFNLENNINDEKDNYVEIDQ